MIDSKKSPQIFLSQDIIAFSLGVSKDFLERVLTFLIDTGMLIDNLIRKIDLILIKKRPSFAQYANRLIEFIDFRFITEAYNRFEQLVMAGIAPDHAFRMVIDQ